MLLISNLQKNEKTFHLKYSQNGRTGLGRPPSQTLEKTYHRSQAVNHKHSHHTHLCPVIPNGYCKSWSEHTVCFTSSLCWKNAWMPCWVLERNSQRSSEYVQRGTLLLKVRPQDIKGRWENQSKAHSWKKHSSKIVVESGLVHICFSAFLMISVIPCWLLSLNRDVSHSAMPWRITHAMPSLWLPAAMILIKYVMYTWQII